MMKRRPLILVFLSQLWLLGSKNALLLVRSWRTTLMQLLSPVVFLFLLFGAQKLGNKTSDNLTPAYRPSAGPVSRCVPFDTPTCVTVRWAWDPPSVSSSSFRLLSESEADAVMARLTSPSFGSGLEPADVVKMNSSAAIEAFSIDHPNQTSVAIVFYAATTMSMLNNGTFSRFPAGSIANATAREMVPYTVYFNRTWSTRDTNSALAVSYHLERSIAKQLTGEDDVMTVAEGPYPQVSNSAFDAVLFVGPMLFFCSVMFVQVLLLYNVVTEKEIGIRAAMKQVGMLDSAYLLTIFLENVLMNVVLSLVTMAAGAAFGLRYFIDASFWAVFLNFFIFGFAMCPLTVLLSLPIKTSRTAINAGMAVFILGVLMEIIFSVPFILQVLYSPTVSRALVTVLQFWPPFNFARVSADIAKKTPQSTTATMSFAWGDLYNKQEVVSTTTFYIPATIDSWGWQFIDFGIFLAIALVLYAVIPSEGGWLTDKFRVLRARRRSNDVADNSPKAESSSVDVDSDVVEEAAEVAAGKSTSAVKIHNVVKVYRKNPFKESAQDVFAVRGVSLGVNKGEVFALLGHNGAGKTTLLSILNGSLTATSGDATVYDNSVVTQLGAVRKIIGVCPQHDVLLPDLTAREHLWLFAGLKQVPRKKLDAEINQRLSDVLLLDVGNNRVSSYSGGMKRRLSIALSFVGDPACVFLDEPTTGLDPVSRRQIWKTIQHMKEDRVILLTTHSMEEADALGDRISIMSGGKLRCLGTALHLKCKYGVGYLLTLSTSDDQADAAKGAVLGTIPNSVLVAQTNGNIKIGVPLDSLDNLAAFLKQIEADGGPTPECRISDWGVSQTTLEEVFIRLK